MAGFAGWRVRLSYLWLSFPLHGNGLFQPLDSSTFVPDLPAAGRRGSTTPPSRAPLQRRGIGTTSSSKFIPQNVEIKVAGMYLVPSSSFQRTLESSGLDKPFPQSRNDDGGIPAFACLLQAGRNDGGAIVPLGQLQTFSSRLPVSPAVCAIALAGVDLAGAPGFPPASECAGFSDPVVFDWLVAGPDRPPTGPCPF